MLGQFLWEISSDMLNKHTVFRKKYKPCNQIRIYFLQIFEQFAHIRSFCKLHRNKKCIFWFPLWILQLLFPKSIFFLLDFRYTMFVCLILFFSDSDKLSSRFRWCFWLCSLFVTRVEGTDWALLAILLALCLFVPNAFNIKFQTSIGGEAAWRC